ncbi:ribonuclease P protein component [Psychrosphaera sp. B3R10]|uniref:ribonuclease P protein component n=1 Tax=unclassified Psychrosphaera TaxID=2641570 RepID=UPI001C09BB61|nr:ribonuclease P protein component [Psychrosphaera sp. 1_MG-2023]MBU2883301.1 ribonuclease P protein component [Psychrosphaera sp. I2R16]MBU2990605.1 ribonuclease P protein component [Psychrosphaera sp. B3R10]MDO6718921.1 ribonuclease P protein component [Psychrosphaera sp. 1_MG-2023]
MKSNTFPRELRLLTPSHFSPVFDRPVKAVSDHFTLLAKYNDLDHPRLGLTIAKKKEKTAVGRNRIKRNIRESFRLNQDNLPNIDIVVLARDNIGDADNAYLQKQLNKLWKKISLRCEQSLKR